MKKLLLAFLASLLIFSSTVSAESFSDVPEGHIYYSAIESLKNLEIVNGYEDGTFKPEAPVNRAEALKMILNSAGVESPEITSETGFPDVPQDAWFARFVVKAKLSAIVDGNADGTFAPGRQVNKAEFIKMLLQSFDIDISKHQGLTEGVSADVNPGDWYLAHMSYAKTIGIIYPSIDNMLEPGRFLSRGETAEIIYKLLIIEYGGDTQKMLNVAEAQLVSVLVDLNADNIAGAITNANSAVFYTEQALSISPDESIVKAANKIALGFRELCYAYQAGLEGDTTALTQYTDQAKDYAGQAYEEDASTQLLGQKIKQQADILLSQI